MGYFSNGTEGMAYEARYCDRCIHQNGPDGNGGCQVWLLHMLHNYEECNKEDSFLHILIPLTKDGLGNEQCTMFIDKLGETSEADVQKRLLI
ncbi:MAG: hypothetical protein ACR2RF_05995 [Geminicoccaceae bacterium]